VSKLDVDKDLEKIREDFPGLKSRIWLDSAGTGPALKYAIEAIKSYWEFMLAGSLEEARRQTETKKEAAKMLHADEYEICWITRVSHGLNMVSSMIKFKRGENIVVTDLGYPSSVYVWLPFRGQGVEVRRINSREGDITLSDFENAVDDKTKVVSVNHVEWGSGLAYDLKEISKIAHDHGAFVVVDAFQSVGAIDVDCHATDIDFLITATGKWLCCPVWAGIFYVRKDLISCFEPTYRPYYRVEEAFYSDLPTVWERPTLDNIADFDKPLVQIAEKFDQGCVSTPALWGLEASLKYFNNLGIKNIERQVRRQSGYVIDGLMDIWCKVYTPLEPERRAGLVIYSTGSPEMNKKSKEKFVTEKIYVSLRAMGSAGGIRVAPHFFNTEAEIDKFLNLQKELMK